MGNIDISTARKAAQNAHETANAATQAAETAIAAGNAAAERIRQIPRTKDPDELDNALARAIRGE